MNATTMLVCLAGGMSAGQIVSQENVAVVSRSPLIEVKRERGEKYEFLYLEHNRIHLGQNHVKPAKPGAADWSRFPTTYFHDKSPIGMVMKRYDWFPGQSNSYSADARVPVALVGMGLDPAGQLANLWSEPPLAVLGLDVGTMAAYARPTQTVHFTERIPAILKLSLPDKDQPRHFHYVQDALDRGAFLRVFDGEPRQTIDKHGGEQFYQVLVIETYKLPVSTLHKDLMTREGMQLLMGKMREDGILCYHTSNRYYDLAPVIASVAKDLKFACVVADDKPGAFKQDRRRDRYSSNWVMVAREWTHLAQLESPVEYDQSGHRYWLPPMRSGKQFIWSDDGKNSFRGLYRSDPSIDRLNNLSWDVHHFLIRNGMPSGAVNRAAVSVDEMLHEWSIRSAAELNGESPPLKNSREKKK